MINVETGRLLTIAEAADYLRQSRTSVYRAISRGELAALQLGAGPRAPLRVRAGELERYLRRHRASDEPRAAA